MTQPDLQRHFVTMSESLQALMGATAHTPEAYYKLEIIGDMLDNIEAEIMKAEIVPAEKTPMFLGYS
jgi:hypothetical protein